MDNDATTNEFDLFTKAQYLPFTWNSLLSVLHIMPYILEMFLLKEYIQLPSDTFTFLFLLSHNTPVWSGHFDILLFHMLFIKLTFDLFWMLKHKSVINI